MVQNPKGKRWWKWKFGSVAMQKTQVVQLEAKRAEAAGRVQRNIESKYFLETLGKPKIHVCKFWFKYEASL